MYGTNDWVGFDMEDKNNNVVKLKSFYIAKYLPSFDSNENYIGFVFAAINVNGTWYMNDKKF